MGRERFRRWRRGAVVGLGMAESESKESKELFQASLPRPARLNFFSAQEFSYYSEFPAAAKLRAGWRTRVPRTHTHTHIRAHVCTREAWDAGSGLALPLCVWLKKFARPRVVPRGWFTGLPAARIAKEISFHRRTSALAAARLNLLGIRGCGSANAPPNREILAWRNDRSRLISVLLLQGLIFECSCFFRCSNEFRMNGSY